MKRRSNSHTYKLTYTDEARDIHRAVIESYLPFTEEFYPDRSKPKDMLKLQEEKFSQPYLERKDSGVPANLKTDYLKNQIKMFEIRYNIKSSLGQKLSTRGMLTGDSKSSRRVSSQRGKQSMRDVNNVELDLPTKFETIDGFLEEPEVCPYNEKAFQQKHSDDCLFL